MSSVGKAPGVCRQSVGPCCFLMHTTCRVRSLKRVLLARRKDVYAPLSVPTDYQCCSHGAAGEYATKGRKDGVDLRRA